MSNDPTQPVEPEYLGETPPEPPKSRSGRRATILGLASVAVVGAVAAGGWAAMSLMSGGTQPAEAVPANVLGYASLDLDPSASQKIEAITMLRKFPGIQKELDISSQDDLRRWVLEKIQEDGQCKDLDYDEDIEPWIGDRIAMAAVPAPKAGDAPTPLVALQVTDADAATKGIEELAACGDSAEDFGVAVSGDYALITDSQKHADAFAADAEESSLAEDATFQRWTSRVGDPGIMTLYAAPGAMDLIVDAALKEDFASVPGSGGVEDKAALQMQSEMKRINERVRELYSGFRGMAGVVRFEGGAVEAEFAGLSENKQLGFAMSPGDRIDVGALPPTTAAVYGAALPKGWAQSYLDLMVEMSGEKRAAEQMIAQLEAQTGLQIPGDIERLLGDGVALAVDEDLDVKAASEDPTTVPAGLRISGDPQEIQAALDKVKRAVGPDGDMLVSEQGDGTLAVGLDQGYVKTLAAGGGLGDQAIFQDVVPDADKAAGVLYVDLDVLQRWISQGMQQSGTVGPDEQKVLDNLAPLRAVGFGSWIEKDKSQHVRLRLTTD